MTTHQGGNVGSNPHRDSVSSALDNTAPDSCIGQATRYPCKYPGQNACYATAPTERTVTDRGRTGRFTKGNSAARGRRSPPRITARLIELIDNKLGEQGELRSLDELVVSAVLQLAEAVSVGDLKACQWIADRFYPRESEPLIQRRRFPSPSQEPLKFLDALSKSVGHGELSTAQAVRLAQLSKPFVLDEALGELFAKFEELGNSVKALEKQRTQVVK